MSFDRPVAIVDIGSNSVRLVIYSGATRAPSVIFNEKVMAGLGRGLDETGALAPEAQRRALSALARFRILIDCMGVVRTRVFATAAAREASNGADFLAQVNRLGFDPEVLSGEEEARLAGLGVISGIADPEGVVGDLGGGSLELVDVADNQVGRRLSLPLGVLRLAAMRARPDAALRREVTRLLVESDFRRIAEGRAFYMVGGSWRALARLDLMLSNHPLPVTHQHVMAPDRPRQLARHAAAAARGELRTPGGGAARMPNLPHANLLLEAVVEALRPSRLVVSALGVREGLLYDDLTSDERALDPLIEAARAVGAGLGRFAEHGEALDAWIHPVFDDDREGRRIRLAACLLSDIAWAAHPDFRAERGIDMALHGNWVGIDARGRARLALALFSVFGGSDFPYPAVAALCSEAEAKRARIWGLAIRLAQRFSGGVREPLARSRLLIQRDALVLGLVGPDAPLFSETVERRLKTLAQALGRKAETLVLRPAADSPAAQRDDAIGAVQLDV
jgi:exopolyphosphatase / guanosine-5'-triphosphate,3'-diphosphate pyrophosphatase